MWLSWSLEYQPAECCSWDVTENEFCIILRQQLLTCDLFLLYHFCESYFVYWEKTTDIENQSYLKKLFEIAYIEK